MARLRRNETKYGYARSRRRPTATRDPKPRLLIVCEGEKTEPLYFRAFPVSTAEVTVVGTGSSCVSLVETAATLRDDDKQSRCRDGLVSEYDEVWCVFDKDGFSTEDVSRAITLAKRRRFRVAFSNEAFELWYLLHFDYHDAALSRTQYARMLQERLGHRYAKNDPGMYGTLLSMQARAIENAQNLLAQYEPRDPAADNPSTTVHELVLELRKWQR